MADVEEAPDAGVAIDEAPENTGPVTVEDFARERGWKPKEEYDGPEEDWRDAGGFLAFGLDRNRDLYKEVKGLRDTTERMAHTQATIMDQAVERARTEERRQWEQRHAQAVEDGDLKTATQAVQQIAELTHNVPRQTGSDPQVDKFVRDHPWFNTDPVAKALAAATAEQVAQRNGTVAEQLEAARQAVHKRFPEYAPTPVKAAPSVSAPGARTADMGGRKKGFNDMPAEAQQACRAMVAKKYTTQDEYVSNYFDKGSK